MLYLIIAAIILVGVAGTFIIFAIGCMESDWEICNQYAHECGAMYRRLEETGNYDEFLHHSEVRDRSYMMYRESRQCSFK